MLFFVVFLMAVETLGFLQIRKSTNNLLCLVKSPHGKPLLMKNLLRLNGHDEEPINNVQSTKNPYKTVLRRTIQTSSDEEPCVRFTKNLPLLWVTLDEELHQAEKPKLPKNPSLAENSLHLIVKQVTRTRICTPASALKWVKEASQNHHRFMKKKKKTNKIIAAGVAAVLGFVPHTDQRTPANVRTINSGVWF
ncbi:hypothetical protein Hdeb2414_s0019g00551621 [Helianthus debilis subsp. tardiflorus]